MIIARLDPRYTHHAWYDTSGTAETIVKALCGASIRRKDSVAVPSCPACLAILADYDHDHPKDDLLRLFMFV